MLLQLLVLAVVLSEFETTDVQNAKFFLFFPSFLSKNLFRDNSVIQEAGRTKVKRKHCAYSGLGRRPIEFVYAKIHQKAHIVGTGRVLPAVRHLGK